MSKSQANSEGKSKDLSGFSRDHPLDAIEGLLALPGVRRKTANLVMTLVYKMPGIGVDTHVHRIYGGYVFTPNAIQQRKISSQLLVGSVR